MAGLSTILTPFLIALASSLALVPLCRLVAFRCGYVAEPKSDRWHRRPTALFGGVAIGCTVLVCAALLIGVREQAVLLVCTSLVFLVGLTDDLFSLSATTKLVAEIAIASIFLFFGYRLGWVESRTLDSVLTVLWIVGITNAFNLLDNMDGLCAGIAVIGGCAFLAASWPIPVGGQSLVEVRYIAILLGATVGFLFYNFNPASIFMGDSGALFIGLNFAALTLSSPQSQGQSNVLSVVMAPVMVLLIPIFDTTFVTISRLGSGLSPSTGGRDHSSHRLVSMGLSERRAVALLWGLALLAGGIGVSVRHLGNDWTSLVALMFLVGMVIFAVYLARVRVYENVDPIALRQREITPLAVNLVYRRRVAEVLLDLCLVSVAYYAAYRLRFADAVELGRNFDRFLHSLPVVVGVQIMALFMVGAYRGVWRYFGLMDTAVFAKGIVAGTLGAQLVLLYFYRFQGYSRAAFAIYAVLLLLLLTASRASFRLMSEYVSRWRQTGRRLIIYGAGDGGSLLARELLNDPGASYKIVGFVDDNPDKHRLRVHGYRVIGGYDRLESLVTDGTVDAVVVSTRLMSVDRLRILETLCAKHNVTLSRLRFDLQDMGPPSIPSARGLGR